jgi:hypothetical protein
MWLPTWSVLCAFKRFYNMEYKVVLKYDRDDLCVNKSQFIPVISEPPCINAKPTCKRGVLQGLMNAWWKCVECELKYWTPWWWRTKSAETRRIEIQLSSKSWCISVKIWHLTKSWTWTIFWYDVTDQKWTWDIFKKRAVGGGGGCRIGTGCCDRGNELSGYIICGQFLD